MPETPGVGLALLRATVQEQLSYEDFHSRGCNEKLINLYIVVLNLCGNN